MGKTLRAISLLAIFALLAVGLVACGGGEEAAGDTGGTEGGGEDAGTEEEVEVYEENGLPKNEEVTIKYGFFEAGAGREWFDYAVDTFTEKFPNVSFDIQASPDIAKITQTKISANDDEDMFTMFDGSVPGGTAPLVEAGKLESVEDLWERELYDTPDSTVKEIAQPGSFETAPRINGESYALPIRGTVGGLFFNQNLFEEHGWNQAPQTWDEFVALLEEIKTDGFIPITFTGVHSYYLEYSFGPPSTFELAEINGNLEEFEDNFRTFTPPYFTSSEKIEMWTRIYELGQKGYFPEGLAALDHIQSQMQVMQGKAAMVSTASWVENEMKDSTPDGFEWGYMAVPMGEAGDTIWIHDVIGAGPMIWSGKPELEKKWAKEFALWMWNMDIQQSLAEEGGTLPVRSDYGDDPERLENMLPSHKAITAYREENNTRGESSFHTITLSDPAFNQAEKALDEAVTNIALGKQDPVPILEEAEELLKKARENEGL